MNSNPSYKSAEVLPDESELDEALADRGVKACTTHLRHPAGSYYACITVATPEHVAYPLLSIALSAIYHEAYLTKRSDLGTLMLDRISEHGYGAALCHHLDNFSRKEGRIRAKVRLLEMVNHRER